uniref:Uncharacterized protein n=1 Tax=Arundo donax TaxID=35708 RepID=A0A0A9HND2_ARUDO
MKVLVLIVDNFPVVAELLVLLDTEIPGAEDARLLPLWTKASMALAQFPIWRDRRAPLGQASLSSLLSSPLLTPLLSCPVLCWGGVRK